MITKIHEFKNALNGDDNTKAANGGLSNDILILKMDDLEPIDPEEWEIATIIDVVRDAELKKKLENAGSNVSMDLTVKSVEVGQILWLTALLKPRNKSTAYPLGEMGVIKVKVMETFYGLNKLNQISKAGKLANG